MVSTVLLLVGAVIGYGLYSQISGLRANIAVAKRSGLPYYICPMRINVLSNLWAFIWVPVVKLLFPRKYWENVELVWWSDWQFKQNHKPFKHLGDTFLLVAPKRIMMITNSAEVIHQVTSRREHFPKPTQDYTILNMYGDNIVTTEGQLWRMHRKITSASFNEKNAALIFTESIDQTQGLLSQWLGVMGKAGASIKTLEEDTMSLMLHIIGYAGFGLKFFWDGQKLPADADSKMVRYSSANPPPGHTLTFKHALGQTLDGLILLMIVPRWLLSKLPFKGAKTAYESENNYVLYMKEFLQDKIEEVRRGDKELGMDIMGHLVRSSYSDKAAEGSTSSKGGKNLALSDAQIIGNAFIMLVAGHETTANTMHFTLVELATNPAVQRLVQRDVDNIFGKTDPKTWDYEGSVNSLLASYVGASMNETLRTMPPVVDIPKQVTNDQDQTITIDGKQHLVPRNTHIDMVPPAVHRNPRYWPSKPSKLTGADNDLDDWVPERWYRTATAEDTVDEDADGEDYGGFSGPDTSAQMFRPVRGSFIAFSDGPRSCLGRRLAVVEMIATLSVIFQTYSLELAVDEWASDEEVERMSKEQRAELYKKAQVKSRETLKTATSQVTLKLHGAHVPVRLVKRGEEKFVNWVDS